MLRFLTTIHLAMVACVFVSLLSPICSSVSSPEVCLVSHRTGSILCLPPRILAARILSADSWPGPGLRLPSRGQRPRGVGCISTGALLTDADASNRSTSQQTTTRTPATAVTTPVIVPDSMRHINPDNICHVGFAPRLVFGALTSECRLFTGDTDLQLLVVPRRLSVVVEASTGSIERHVCSLFLCAFKGRGTLRWHLRLAPTDLSGSA